MSMTIIISRAVEDRYRGFILSCMPEISPGVYVTSKMNPGIRERLWEVLSEWHNHIQNGSIIMIYPDKNSPSGLKIESLGEIVKEVVDFDGFYVSMKRQNNLVL